MSCSMQFVYAIYSSRAWRRLRDTRFVQCSAKTVHEYFVCGSTAGLFEEAKLILPHLEHSWSGQRNYLSMDSS